MTMFYRAKITKIQNWVEDYYSVNAYTFLRDAKDVYIEVKDEDEAELIEKLNKLEEEISKLKLEWYEKFG